MKIMVYFLQPKYELCSTYIITHIFYKQPPYNGGLWWPLKKLTITVIPTYPSILHDPALIQKLLHSSGVVNSKTTSYLYSVSEVRNGRWLNSRN